VRGPSQSLDSWSKAPRVGRRRLLPATTGAHPRKPTAVGSGLHDPPMHPDKTAKVANHGCTLLPAAVAPTTAPASPDLGECGGPSVLAAPEPSDLEDLARWGEPMPASSADATPRGGRVLRAEGRHLPDGHSQPDLRAGAARQRPQGRGVPMAEHHWICRTERRSRRPWSRRSRRPGVSRGVCPAAHPGSGHRRPCDRSRMDPGHGLRRGDHRPDRNAYLRPDDKHPGELCISHIALHHDDDK
jgi:hypothetical protein